MHAIGKEKKYSKTIALAEGPMYWANVNNNTNIIITQKKIYISITPVPADEMYRYIVPNVMTRRAFVATYFHQMHASGIFTFYLIYFDFFTSFLRHSLSVSQVSYTFFVLILFNYFVWFCCSFSLDEPKLELSMVRRRYLLNILFL